MTKFYLVRQAESMAEDGLPEELWPLSPAGQSRARRIVSVLGTLGIEHIYASSDRGAIETVQPLAQIYRLKILVLNELREHKIAKGGAEDLTALRAKTWEDFDFVPENHESSRQAQRRLVRVIQSLMLHHQEEVVAISLHSNAIALFLNAIDPSFTWERWAKDGIPDLLGLSREEYRLAWIPVETKLPSLSIVGKKGS